MNEFDEILPILQAEVEYLSRQLRVVTDLVIRLQRGETLDARQLKELLDFSRRMAMKNPDDITPFTIDAQLKQIRTYMFVSNSILEFGRADGGYWLRVNGGGAVTLSRAKGVIMERLVIEARRDPSAYVTAQQLLEHVHKRLPAHVNWTPENLHRAIHDLRKICDAIETSEYHAGGYRLSTPNIMPGDGTDR